MTFRLRIDPRPEEKLAALTLRDEHDVQLAARQVRLADHSPADWEGAFDARRYVRHYEQSLREGTESQARTAEQLLERIGVFLGHTVLGGQDGAGSNLLAPLIDAAGNHGRQTLIVELAGQADNLLTAAFANVPWEIARSQAGQPTLLDQNIVVRAVAADMPELHDPVAAITLPQDQSLKVLLVFAEAPGARPLAMRQERRELLDLFFDQVLRRNNVTIDVLCHGVTKDRLVEQITRAGGYHVVHWSGHGLHNCVDLMKTDGTADRLTGAGLVNLFRTAGGFQPHLVFLSACLSGSVITVSDWVSLRMLIAGERGGGGDVLTDRQSLDDILSDPAGFTGMALELLRAGVPQVVAMRYEVGDTFARELAGRFYRHLLVDPAAHDVDSALTLARTELLNDTEHAAEYFAVDHATPLMFGRSGRLPRPAAKRSAQFELRDPKPSPVLRASRELEPHTGFVGRSRELRKLAGAWLPLLPGAVPDENTQPSAVALLQGMAGLGKTALAAEVIDLWHDRFDFVLACQAKPLPLSLDDFYRDLDTRLKTECRDYRERCQSDELQAIFIPHDAEREPDARYQRMRDNLLRTLDDWKILLLIDNYERNLEQHPVGGGATGGAQVYRSADARWDELLTAVAGGLADTSSRLIVTSRHRLAALTDRRLSLRESASAAPADPPPLGEADTDTKDASFAERKATMWLPLGRLPMDEAALCVRTHTTLRRLFFADDEGRELVERLLQVSGGHPLILDRLSRLAADRTVLREALDELKEQGWQSVPHLFKVAGTDAEREAERRYLEDVSIGAVDLLLKRLSADARRLLWLISLALEPQPQSVIAGVWSGKSAEDEQPDALAALLEELHSAGLVSRETVRRTFLSVASGDDPEATSSTKPTETPTFDVHELVRERVTEWFSSHPDERGGRTDTEIQIAYGERYADQFQHWHMAGAESGVEHARDFSAEAGRRAVRYLCRASAFDRLGRFASRFVTSTVDPRILREVIAELTAVADSVPAGNDRWSLRTYLADAILRAGRPEQALPLYADAAREAEHAGNWSHVATIRGNHANALREGGNLPESRAMHLASAAASHRAEHPDVHAVARELEALRIDVMTGGPGLDEPMTEASGGREPTKQLPVGITSGQSTDKSRVSDDCQRADARRAPVRAQIATRLDRLRAWWQAHQQGNPPAEAPDHDVLGRALVGGLGIAENATRASAEIATGEAARADWQTCLELLEEAEQTQAALGIGKFDRLATTFNKYGPLIRLFRLDQNPQRLSETEQLLHEYRDAFRDAGDALREAKALSGLADVWDERGDARQAAELERQALSLKNSLPDALVRSVSHNNLASYLGRLDGNGVGREWTRVKDGQECPSYRVSSAGRHRLAAIVYLHELGQEPWVHRSLQNLAIELRRGRYELPKLDELLDDGEFSALSRWLTERGVDRDQLRQALDARIAPLRQQIEDGPQAKLLQFVAAISQLAADQGPEAASEALDQLVPQLIEAGLPQDQVNALLATIRSQWEQVDGGDLDDDDEPAPGPGDTMRGIDLNPTRGGEEGEDASPDDSVCRPPEDPSDENSETGNPGEDAISQMVDYLAAVVDPHNQLVKEHRDGNGEANNSGQGLHIDMDDVTALPFDANGDDTVTPRDALRAVSEIGRPAAGDLIRFDTDQDGEITSLLNADVVEPVPRLYSVWFGTNRQPKSKDDLSKGFTSRRSPHVYYGACDVSIPRSHRLGSVGSGWFRRLIKWTDDRLKLQTLRGLDIDGFWQSVREDLAARDDGQRQALVFLHGYRVSFEDAAIQAAQIGFDLKVPGLTAFFSWPSGGRLLNYRKDGESIQASEASIADFLIRFAQDSGAERVHLIAHSMGNRGLLRAMQRIAAQAAEAGGVRFGQVFLAAPDVDVDVFRDLAHVYPQLAERTTLYVSPQDKAVSVSRLLHGEQRVGRTPPVTVLDGIDTIEVRNGDLFNLFDLHHGYFATAAGVLHDMFDLLRRNASPDERQRPEPQRTPDGQTYWTLPD